MKVDLFVYEDFALIAEEYNSVFAHERISELETTLMLCSLTGEVVELEIIDRERDVLGGSLPTMELREGRV